jgi:hypothetical protein
MLIYLATGIGTSLFCFRGLEKLPPDISLLAIMIPYTLMMRAEAMRTFGENRIYWQTILMTMGIVIGYIIHKIM